MDLVLCWQRNEIENGVDDIQWLIKSLNTLPVDLDELYKHIFKSLPTPIRQRAYRTLAMTDAATRHKLGITPTGYSFFTDDELDPERIMQKPFLKAMNGEFSPTQRA